MIVTVKILHIHRGRYALETRGYGKFAHRAACLEAASAGDQIE
jgi:hypothetical protein